MTFFSHSMALFLSSINLVGTIGLLILRNKFPIIVSCNLLLHSANAATCFEYSNEAPALLASPETSKFSSASINTINFLSSAYAIYDATIFKRIKFNAGLRFDHNQLANTFDLSPRVTIGYDLTSSTILSASWGSFDQSPTTYQILQNKKCK